MEEYTKQSIDARYNSFFSAYYIEDESIKNKIEDLFVRIRELGETAKDNGDFETKLASSPLNNEYIELFTEVATKCKPKEQVSAPTYNEGENTNRMIQNETKRMVEDATRPIRRKLRWKLQDKMRDTPLGTVEQVINLRGLFKKNK